MPAKKTEAKPKAAPQPPAEPDRTEDKAVSEVMVVKTTDEPVRCGGHILTDNGWVPEEG